MVGEKGGLNIISTNRATHVAGSINYPYHLEASKTSSDDNKTFNETNPTPTLRTPSPAPLPSKKTFTKIQKDLGMKLLLNRLLYKSCNMQTGINSPLMQLRKHPMTAYRAPLRRLDQYTQAKKAERLLWKTDLASI